MKLKIVIGCVALAAAASAEAMDEAVRKKIATHIGFDGDPYNDAGLRHALKKRVEPLLARKGNAASSVYDVRIEYIRQLHEKNQSDADYLTEVGSRVIALDEAMQRNEVQDNEWYYNQPKAASNSGIGAFFGKPLKCVQHMCGAAKTIIVAAVMGGIVLIHTLLNKSNTQKPQGNLNDLD